MPAKQKPNLEGQQTEIESPAEAENPAGSEDRPAALTIHIHSWATPIFTLVALVMGLLGGYYGRPLLAERFGQEDPQAAAQTGDTPAAVEPPSGDVSREEMMDFLVSQTRHFKGDPDAPVTMIEFSDFQ